MEDQNTKTSEVKSDVEVNVEETNKSSENPQASGKNPRMAGFFERFVAVFIDGIVVNLVVYTLGLSTGTLNFNFSGGQLNTVNSGFSPLYSLATIGLAYLYFAWFYVNKGQTPGKMVMKIKVVKSDNLNYLSWGDVAIREVIGKLVSSIAFYLGYLWYFMSEKRQTWHDMIASTYVVKTDDKGELLMDGPENYKKEPVKAFLPCGCMVLLLIALFALMAYAASVFLPLINEQLNNSMPLDQDQMRMLEDMPQFESEEEMRMYFEENFPEEYEMMEEEFNRMETEMETQMELQMDSNYEFNDSSQTY